MERLSVNDSFCGTNLSELTPASDQVGPITTLSYCDWLLYVPAKVELPKKRNRL
jgi:hypothetical protein